MIATEKSRLRAEMLARLKNSSAERRAEQSAKIAEKLIGTPEFGEARTIGFYASQALEVSTDALIEHALAAGRKVVLPRLVNDEPRFYAIKKLADLKIGSGGFREPSGNAPEIDLAEIDLLIVPALALDRAGNRLGRGGGFYDRVLQNFTGTSIGLAFDFQILEKIPAEPHDRKVDRIFSANEIE